MQTWFIYVAVLALSICGLALLRGRAPERLVAICLAGEFAFHQVMEVMGRRPPFVTVTGEQFLPNIVLLILFLTIAIRANRVWTIWLAALQVLRFTSHLVALVWSGGYQEAYWIMSQLPLAGQLMALLLGTLAVKRRTRHNLHFVDWR